MSLPVTVPDTYWLVPGKVLAGPYPARQSRPDTIRKLRALIAAGVTMFVDLTEEGEHVVYSDLLAAVADSHRREVRYVRKPLVDHKVPPQREVMVDILQCLRSAVEEGQCIYLHCRAGIGRTGTVAGCYLIEQGMAPEEALDHLQRLWEESGRTTVWPHTPETDEQADYVRHWQSQEDAADASIEDEIPVNPSGKKPWWKIWA